MANFLFSVGVRLFLVSEFSHHDHLPELVMRSMRRPAPPVHQVGGPDEGCIGAETRVWILVTTVIFTGYEPFTPPYVLNSTQREIHGFSLG